MKVVVDETLCTACSLCYTDAPEVFGMRDDGIATVLVESPAGALLDKAKDAAANCPSEAIKVA